MKNRKENAGFKMKNEEKWSLFLDFQSMIERTDRSRNEINRLVGSLESELWPVDTDSNLESEGF